MAAVMKSTWRAMPRPQRACKGPTQSASAITPIEVSCMTITVSGRAMRSQTLTNTGARMTKPMQKGMVYLNQVTCIAKTIARKGDFLCDLAHLTNETAIGASVDFRALGAQKCRQSLPHR